MRHGRFQVGETLPNLALLHKSKFSFQEPRPLQAIFNALSSTLETISNLDESCRRSDWERVVRLPLLCRRRSPSLGENDFPALLRASNMGNTLILGSGRLLTIHLDWEMVECPIRYIDRHGAILGILLSGKPDNESCSITKTQL